MLSTVRKWGNSAAVRLPASVMDEAKLRLDQEVEMRVEHGAIFIVPRPSNIDIDAMIDEITPENRHDEVDWGPPVGKEVW